MAKAAKASNKTTTRYERVRQILDRAAGASTADYGGLGRFWHLPLAELIEARLLGVRLIAPPGEAGHSCCHGGSSGASRGAASGLIRGLRGQDPFDGSRFPRLPWGGAAVPDGEILFISEWIDDGLPEADRVLGSFPAVGELSPPVTAEIAPDNAADLLRAAPAMAPTAAAGERYAYDHGEPRQRVNVDCMSETQLEKLRFAFREMYRLNKWPADRRSYNSIAQVHQDHCQHGWERFLPWHRIYLYEFEQAMQDLVPDVSLPYWDWVMPQYCPRHPELGIRIPYSFQMFLTEASIEQLEGGDPKLPAAVAKKLAKAMTGKHFATLTGFFAEVGATIDPRYTQGAYRNRFIDVLLDANSLWYPLRYPGQYQTKDGDPSTINKVIHYHYPKPEDIAEILSLRSFRDFGGGSLYNDAFGFLDQNPHNTMHIWTGGMNPDYDPASAVMGTAAAASGGGAAARAAALDPRRDAGTSRNRGVVVGGRRFHSRDDMHGQPQFGDMFSNLTASYDPVFWPIHVNVDRLWWEWQQMHPQSLPADLTAVLTPWSYTVADTLEISHFGYEYVRSSCIIPIGTGTPVGRFVSQPIGVADTVRAFRQAEVRLHRVPQLARSCFVRVFLNLPDASAETSIDDPRYAGYLAVFGHGDCIGGPGHCETPPGRPRKFDLRPRSHNTPRNHRVNVTRTARALVDAGATSLQITLVVIGGDYCADSDLLRLEGVSLTFLD